MIQPLEIRLRKDKSLLSIAFDSNNIYEYSAEFLRVYSPSAEVVGHGKGHEKLVFGKKNVKIKNIEPVGSYAVKITFSDGHNTGFYNWDYLLDLGIKKDFLWDKYLLNLDNSGLLREG